MLKTLTTDHIQPHMHAYIVVTFPNEPFVRTHRHTNTIHLHAKPQPTSISPKVFACRNCVRTRALIADGSKSRDIFSAPHHTPAPSTPCPRLGHWLYGVVGFFVCVVLLGKLYARNSHSHGVLAGVLAKRHRALYKCTRSDVCRPYGRLDVF